MCCAIAKMQAPFMVTTLPEGRVDGGTMPPAQSAGLLQFPLPVKKKLVGMVATSLVSSCPPLVIS